MELVPILSTIILVGTIATFILAVFAYILYKIRERQGRAGQAPAAAPPDEAEEEDVEPHVYLTPHQDHNPPGMISGTPGMAPGMMTPQTQAPVYIPTTMTQQGPMIEFEPPPGISQPGFAPIQPSMPSAPTPYSTAPEMPNMRPAEPQNSLFWEYTDDGFVPVSGQQPQMPMQSAPPPASYGQPQPPPQAPAPQQHQEEEEEGDDGFAWL